MPISPQLSSTATLQRGGLDDASRPRGQATRLWLARVVVLVTAVALFVCVGSMRPTQAAAAPVKPLTQAQLHQLAVTEYRKLTPTQKQAVTQLARRIANGKVPASVARTFPEHTSSSNQSSVSTMAVPAAVWAIAVLILRYGVPWVIRNAPQQFNNMMRNYAIRWAVCNLLRSWGNSWGWSWVCAGT